MPVSSASPDHGELTSCLFAAPPSLPIRTAVGNFAAALSLMTAGEQRAENLKALVERTKIDLACIDKDEAAISTKSRLC